MALSKAEKLSRVHADSIKLFNSVQSSMRNERLQCLKDRRFYSIAGAQWEGNLGAQFENKPKLEINKIHLAVMRIVSERRNNRIDVEFISKDGNDASDLADTCQGLFRADEQDSGAEEAYDNAFEEAVGGGFGAFRLRAELEDEFDDTDGRQRIRIEPIVDADASVFFDLGAKRMDKSDAKHCWVINAMTHEDYQEQYGELPDDTLGSQGRTSVQKIVHQNEFDWQTPDVVYVAEYYRVEESKEDVQTWTDLAGNETTYDQDEFDEEPELETSLRAIGSQLTDTKKLSRRRVHKYVMDGQRILEDCGLIAGQHIPIVPVYGKRWFVDNVERCMGHVRLATDAQRLLNMQVSKLAEIAATSSVQKPIFTSEQMAGHTSMWSEDNIRNYPYLLINALANPDGSITPAGPVGYTKSPDLPPALSAIVQMTNSDLLDLLGNQQQADKMVSNIGEKTAMLAASRVDMQTYIFTDNFAKALRRAGQVWLSMAREIYDEAGRAMKSLDASGGVSSIKLKQPTIANGVQVSANDLDEANFDVAVSVGPASESRKSAVLRTVTELLPMFTQADPQTARVLGMYAVRNIDGEGMGDLHEFMRKQLVQAGVVQASQDDLQKGQGQGQQQDPQMMAQVQAMQAMADQATAEASLSRVKILKETASAQNLAADAEKTKAETMALVQGMKTDELQRLLGMIAQLRGNGQMA